MIGFVLTEEEIAREEKRRFYQGQIDRLRSVGLEARLFEYSDEERALPGAGWVAVFDVECRKWLRRHLDEARIPHAPLIWRPYSLIEVGQTWIRSSPLVIEALAPGPAAGLLLGHYALGKPVETLTVSADRLDQSSAVRLSATGKAIARVGYLGETGMAMSFLEGSVARRWPEFADLEWVSLDFQTPARWRDDLARCDVLLSLRGLCGSAIPLLDAMASGVVVAGTHGGGLRDIAGPENGIWIDSATLETVAEEFVAGLKRLQAQPNWHGQLLNEASETAKRVSPDETFDDNLDVWRRLIQRAGSA